MQSLRVAFITHYSSLYGANRSLLAGIDGLSRHNVASTVFMPADGPLRLALEQRKVAYAFLPFHGWMAPRLADNADWKAWRAHKKGILKRLLKNLRVLPNLCTQLRRNNINLIESNSSMVVVGSLAAKLLGVAHVWHVRELWDLHYGYEVDWGMTMYRSLFNGAAARIAVSNFVATELLTKGVRKPIDVIYNGVISAEEMNEYSRFSLPNRITDSVKERPFTFGLIGLLHPNKGQDVAIQAMAHLIHRHPSARLVIVGDGNNDYKSELIAQTRLLGVESKVLFMDYVPDVYDTLLQFDATLVCSRYEAMGRVAVESMAVGRPVIGRNEGGVRELIEPGETGLLYNGGSVELSRCMSRLIENPSWAAELGRKGQALARTKFTNEQYAEALYTVFRNALNLNQSVNNGT